MDEELDHCMLEDPFSIGHLQGLVLALKAQLIAHHFLPELLAAIMCIVIFTGAILLNLNNQVTSLRVIHRSAILTAFHGSSHGSLLFEISRIVMMVMNVGRSTSLIMPCLIAHLILLFVLVLNQNPISMHLICIVNLRHHNIVALAPIVNNLSGLLLLVFVFFFFFVSSGLLSRFNLNLLDRNTYTSSALHNNNIN